MISRTLVTLLALAGCIPDTMHSRPRPYEEIVHPLTIVPGTLELGLVGDEDRPDINGNKPRVRYSLLFAFRGTAPDNRFSFHLTRDGTYLGKCNASVQEGPRKSQWGGINMVGAEAVARSSGEETYKWQPLAFQRWHGLEQGCKIEAPGRYTIRESKEPTDPGPELAFEVVEVASLNGTSLGISNRDLYGFADLRRGHAENYFGAASFDHGDELSLWITIPMGIEGTDIPVDMVFYAGDRYMGSASRDVPSRWYSLETRVDNPVRVFAWPDDLPITKVQATGPWSVHVVHNGKYVTTCTFDSGKLPTLAERIPCGASADPTVADALKRAKKVSLAKRSPDDQRSAKEARALARSELVRRQYRIVQYTERSEGRQGAMATGIEAELEDRNLSSRERRRLERDKARAEEGAYATAGALDHAIRTFNRLVDQYGR
jgi:hypothetical protein